MVSRVRSMWMLLPVLVGGVAFAAVKSGGGERADAGAAPVAAAAIPAKRGEAEKKRVRLDPELATALYRVGLQPEHLAAGGVTANEATAVVVAVEGWLATYPSALAAADATYFEAITRRDKLVRKVVSGLASAQEIADCQTAKSDFSAAEAGRKELLATLFNSGVAGLAGEVQDGLRRIQVNDLAWELPTAYLVTDRTEADWVHLRDALANERISAKSGVEPDGDEQAYLAGVRAEQAIAAASAHLNTDLGAVQSVWEAAAAEKE